MNQRIQELLNRANLFCRHNKTVSLLGENYCGQAEIEEFAKLIVRECIKTVQDRGEAYSAYLIEKYFDVLFSKEPQGWVCSRCGVDRTKGACSLGHNAALTGQCPMMEKEMTKLSDVPHDKVIGLQVISCSTGAKGIVTEAYRDTRYIEDDIDGYFVHIEWDNGNISRQRHYMLDRVEVIEQ